MVVTTVCLGVFQVFGFGKKLVFKYHFCLLPLTQDDMQIISISIGVFKVDVIKYLPHWSGMGRLYKLSIYTANIHC